MNNSVIDLIRKDKLNLKNLKSIELLLNYKLFLEINYFFIKYDRKYDSYNFDFITEILNKINCTKIISIKINIHTHYDHLISLFNKHDSFPNLKTFHFSISTYDHVSNCLVEHLFDFLRSTKQLRTLSLSLG